MLLRCCCLVACLLITRVVCAAPPAADMAPVAGFLKAHCYDCHADGAREGGLDLKQLGTDLADAETLRRWVLLHDRVAKGEMPPKDEPRPAAATQQKFLAELAAILLRHDAARRETVHRRLNRIEYQNTVRDLFGIHADVADMLPEDAKSHGFDNIGEALGSSTELLQAYLEAADVV